MIKKSLNKKYVLFISHFILLLLFCTKLNAQNNTTCESAYLFWVDPPYEDSLCVNFNSQNFDYGCLTYTHSVQWYYFYVHQSGNIELVFSSPTNNDLDFACWGPFTDYIYSSSSFISDSCTDCPSHEIDSTFYPSGNLIDCSYSIQLAETLRIANAQQGQLYKIAISNYFNLAGKLLITQLNYGQQGSANINNGATLLLRTANPSNCDSLTGFYSLNFSTIEHSIYTCYCPGNGFAIDSTSLRKKFMTFIYEPEFHVLDSIPSDGQLHKFYLFEANNDSTLCTTYYRYFEYIAPEVCNLTFTEQENQNKSELVIYPNPTINELNIDYKIDEPLNYEIYEITGILLFKGNLIKENKIQLGQLEDGVYLIRLYNSKYNLRQKFIKNFVLK